MLIPIDAEAKPLFSWIARAVSATFVLTSDNDLVGVDNAHLDLVLVNEYTVSALSPKTTLVRPVKHESLACILFEHRSLKTRKAIAYDHRSLATVLLSQASALGIGPSSRVIQLSSYNVDVSLTEIFTTLLSGGCVCMPSASERFSDLTRAVHRMGVNWMYLTPVLSRRLRPEDLPSLSVVCFRAPNLDADSYKSWAGKARVLLAYGPQEVCPLGISVAEVTDVDAIHSVGNSYYGNFWVVSPEANNRLMPVGAVGELLYGSPTRTARVDLKEVAVEKWSARILADDAPVSGEGNTQLVKMGQLARYRENGMVEFVTFLDREAHRGQLNPTQQSEIEGLLRRSLGDGIDVVVETVAFEDGRIPPMIAAFIELGDNLRQTEVELSSLSRATKEILRRIKQAAELAPSDTLPTHLMPSTYIPIKKLPLTPSLEVNRRALHKLVAGLSRKQLLNLAANTEPPKSHDPELKPLPFTEIEMQLRDIWADVLGLPKAFIKSGDRFLSLGGDAMLAHKLVISCREKRIWIQIVDLLRNLTLSELAKTATTFEEAARDRGVTGQPRTPESTVTSGNMSGNFDLDLDLFEDVIEASSLQTLAVEAGSLQHRGDISYFVINLTGSTDRAKLECACSELTSTHPILRTGFESRGQRLMQTVFRPQTYSPTFRRYRCPGWRVHEVVKGLIERDQSRPVDFRKPITKFIFVQGGKVSSLVMRLSRAQYSEATLPLLLRDLGRLYDDSDSVERQPGFRDVVRAAGSAARTSNSARYWRNLLEGSAMTHVVSHSSPTVPAKESATVSQKIPLSAVQKLGFPFEVVLKAAWSSALSQLSGVGDVVFGQLIEAKSQGVVGPLGNIIPVRARPPGTSVSPYEYLESFQSQHNTSMTHGRMESMDIIRDCTSWPAWTRFASVVQHVEPTERDTLGKVSLGQATCELNRVEPNYQHADILIRSVTPTRTTIDISLTTREGEIPLSFANEAMRLLHATIMLIISSPARSPLSFSSSLDGYIKTRIPLTSSCRPDAVSTKPAKSVLPNRARAINKLVVEAWDVVLGNPELPANQPNTPFYDVWGSLVPAAELARYYTTRLADLKLPGLQHASFSAEEIISHPTAADQYELIVSKQKASKHKFCLRSPTRDTHDWDAQISPIQPDTHTTLQSPTFGNSSSSSSPTAKEPVGRFSDSSMGSMTSGSSRSDQDELREDMKPGNPVSPSRLEPKQLMGMPGAKVPAMHMLNLPLH